jgi:SAM-dependent methyltransferase
MKTKFTGIIRIALLQLRARALYYLNKGNNRYCPICNKSLRKFGKSKRKDAACYYCGSLERHRLVWLYLKRMTNLFDEHSKLMLHVAPEPCLENLFKKHLGRGYISADIQNPRATIKMDVTDIHFPDETFDVIYCSHVLEHISEDKRALREFHRVLKFDGWTILLVPIAPNLKRTFEDPSVTDPMERLRLFGQEDHVRRYGQDFGERVRETNFFFNVIKPSDFLSEEEIELMGITQAAGEIYYCTKNPPTPSAP